MTSPIAMGAVYSVVPGPDNLKAGYRRTPMSPSAIASVIFGCSFGAALIGMLLHIKLPEHHLNASFRDVVKLVMGLIATMAALVLSLLTAHRQKNPSDRAAKLLEHQQACLQDALAHLHGAVPHRKRCAAPTLRRLPRLG